MTRITFLHSDIEKIKDLANEIIDVINHSGEAFSLPEPLEIDDDAVWELTSTTTDLAMGLHHTELDFLKMHRDLAIMAVTSRVRMHGFEPKKMARYRAFIDDIGNALFQDHYDVPELDLRRFHHDYLEQHMTVFEQMGESVSRLMVAGFKERGVMPYTIKELYLTQDDIRESFYGEAAYLQYETGEIGPDSENLLWAVPVLIDAYKIKFNPEYMMMRQVMKEEAQSLCREPTEKAVTDWQFCYQKLLEEKNETVKIMTYMNTCAGCLREHLENPPHH